MSYIVLAQEDEDSAATMINALMRVGHAVAHFTDGNQAIEAISFRTPHLVILDCKLPLLSGIQALRIIRRGEGHLSLPIMMLADRATLADQRIARFEGANGYLVKPVSADELVYQSGKLINLAATRRPAKECNTGHLHRSGRPSMTRQPGASRRFC